MTSPHAPSPTAPGKGAAPSPDRPQPDRSSAGSVPGTIGRDDNTDPVFLLITPDRVELHTLAWFSEYWSREAGHSRARQHSPLFFGLPAPGTVRPQSFCVHGEDHHGHAYADGRRFLHCTATLTTVPDHPADQPLNYRFHYWQHDGGPGEPPVTDVETYALPPLNPGP